MPEWELTDALIVTMTARKVRHAACSTALVLLVGASSAAARDDVAKVELGVGYALLFSPDGQPSLLPVGLAVDLTVNPVPAIGLVGEAGASYNEGPEAVQEIAVLGGLRYSIRRRVVLSLEALGGGVKRTQVADGPAEATWQGALQAGAALSFKVGPDVLLRTSVSFRKPFTAGEPSGSFRFFLGATLGLRRSGSAGAMAKASGPQGATLGAPPAPALPPPTADNSSTLPTEPTHRQRGGSTTTEPARRAASCSRAALAPEPALPASELPLPTSAPHCAFAAGETRPWT